MDTKKAKWKNKGLLAAAIIFFLIVNTTYYWQSKLGLLAMPAFFILVLVFLVLSVALINQLYLGFNDNFRDRGRIVTIGLLAIVLLLTFLEPVGIINFEKFEADDVLVVQREGAANCTTTLKLKENMKFTEKNYCFGVTEITGDYEVRNDTVYFRNIETGRGQSEFYTFAVLKPSKLHKGHKSEIVRYKDRNETIGNALWITKNELNALALKKPNR
jgi:hypothetical protein